MQKAGIALFAFILFMGPTCKMQAQEPTRTIEVHAHRFSFEPSNITVRSGETVRLRVVSDDVPHSLLIRQVGIDVVASKSHPGEIVFTASQPGVYEGRCGRFCGSGHGRMVFTLNVTGD